MRNNCEKLTVSTNADQLALSPRNGEIKTSIRATRLRAALEELEKQYSNNPETLFNYGISKGLFEAKQLLLTWFSEELNGKEAIS